MWAVVSVFVAPLSLEKIALSVLLIIMAPDALFVSIFFIFFIFYLFIYLFYFFVLLRTTHSLQLDQNYSILVFFIYKYFTDCNPADTCNGHGKCNGSGLCECNPGFIGNCHHCAENFYGPNCDVGMYFFLLSSFIYQCINNFNKECEANTTCRGNGVCNHGTGECDCDPKDAGVSCSGCIEHLYGPSCIKCISCLFYVSNIIIMIFYLFTRLSSRSNMLRKRALWWWRKLYLHRKFHWF